MAHHHAPNHPRDEGKAAGDSAVPPTPATQPNLGRSSQEVEKEMQNVISREKRKSIVDYQIGGFPWEFAAIMFLIAAAVLGMILKVIGVF